MQDTKIRKSKNLMFRQGTIKPNELCQPVINDILKAENRPLQYHYTDTVSAMEGTIRNDTRRNHSAAAQ